MNLLHWLETQTNTETLKEIDKRIQNNQYRIVQCCNHEWYLLTKNKWWFGYTPTYRDWETRLAVCAVITAEIAVHDIYCLGCSKYIAFVTTDT